MTTNLLAHWPFAFEPSIRSLIIAFDLPLPVSATPMWTWRIRPSVRTAICPFPRHCSFLAHVTALDVVATDWTLVCLCNHWAHNQKLVVVNSESEITVLQLEHLVLVIEVLIALLSVLIKLLVQSLG